MREPFPYLVIPNALDSLAVSALRKRMVTFHTSGTFLRQVLGVFGNTIRSLYPHLDAPSRSLADLRAGVCSA